MKKGIVVLDNDPNTGNEVSEILTEQPFQVAHVKSLADCQTHLRQHPCCVLLLDLDTVDVDNRAIVQLKRNHPTLNIIAKSRRKFHPELEESLRSHIFACLTKPLDPTELRFWLRSLTSSHGCR